MSRGNCDPAAGLLLNAGLPTIIDFRMMSTGDTANLNSNDRTIVNMRAFILLLVSAYIGALYR